MVFLKKITTAVFVLMLASYVGCAQTDDDMQKAFKASYASEYKGDYNGSISALQSGYKADSYECNVRMGWLYYKAKNYGKSMDYYQKAIDDKKYSVEARLGYIKPATEAKKYDKVYDMYEQILKIDPYNSTANYWVGVNYYSVKKYDIAAKYFQLVVNMYPFDYDANHMLAWTFLNLGRTAEAKVLFKKALLNRPGDASATEGLSKIK
jgi:tetratricopeptide (TPR) repeat protein